METKNNGLAHHVFVVFLVFVILAVCVMSLVAIVGFLVSQKHVVWFCFFESFGTSHCQLVIVCIIV